MRKQIEIFWRDERGYMPATEWMLAATILTLGSLAALLAMHNADDPSADCPAALVHSGSINK